MSYSRGLRPARIESLGDFLDNEFTKLQQALDLPQLQRFAVADLPDLDPRLVGVLAYATDARNGGEGAGSGTGSTVEWTGTIWKIPGIAGAVAA
jgi:hypothetical protein